MTDGERERVVLCVAECRDELRATLRSVTRPDPCKGDVWASLSRVEELCRDARRSLVHEAE